MAFNIKKFRKTKFGPRLREVRLPELAAWFDDNSDPVFTVRGLNGEEMYQVREADDKRRDLQAIAAKLLSGNGAAMAEAIEAFYGSVPAEFARRVEILIHGCVEPKLERHDVMRFFKNFPQQAHMLCTEILVATGEGSQPGELKGSGETPGSDSTSTSHTSEASASSNCAPTCSPPKP